MIVPAADPTLLPALNRRLADAGIPWSVDPGQSTGEAELMGDGLPAPLSGVQARAWYELTLVGDPPAPTRTLAEVNGRPWAVEGTDAGGRRYFILASPLEPGATTLPVSTSMLRFIDWVASEWAGAGGDGGGLTTGEHLPAPGGATHVRFPGRTQVPIDGTRTVRGTGQAGLYTFLEADTVVAVVALNPPVAESRLGLLERDEFRAAIGRAVFAVDDEAGWERAIFRARQGPEMWWPLLLAVLGLLLAESFVATSGTRGTRGTRGTPDPHASTAAPETATR